MASKKPRTVRTPAGHEVDREAAAHVVGVMRTLQGLDKVRAKKAKRPSKGSKK